MNRSVASCLLLAGLMALPAVWPERPYRSGVQPTELTPGPLLTIRWVARTGDRLHLSYEFRRIEVDRNLSFSGPTSAVECLFWDASGNRNGPFPTEKGAFRDGFGDEPFHAFRGLAVVDVPHGAKFVALMVNHDERKSTSRVAVPGGSRKGSGNSTP